MRHLSKLLGMVLVVSWCLPLGAFAAHIIGAPCSDCHKIGANPRAMANVCNTSCHDQVGSGEFTADKASNALDSHPTPPSATKQTSHFWGGSTTLKVGAGSTHPQPTYYSSRYKISTNRVTCSICHDPHQAVGSKLLRKTMDDDLICQQCHTGFYRDDINVYKTHPVGTTANYAAALLASPTKYLPTPVATATGVVGLVNGVVSCSSCHAPHFADSKSGTTDGIGNVAALTGDGHLLKANGPAEADNSLLCQTCHTYMAHGKVGSERVGCLTCHSGHNIVGNSNVYVLRNSVTTTLFGTKAITYTTTNTSWNDNVAGTATGYCEVCHGSAESIPKQSGYHLVGAVCRDCHLHRIEGGTYSFQNDANAATCGDCHGFPPYKDIRGDRLADAGAFYAARDGGFAYTTATHNYSQDAVTGGYKSEVTTPHNTHAAGSLPQGSAATDYIFGSGVLACDPCHLDLSTAPTHSPAVDPGSYQNLAWNSLSTANGLLSPSYATIDIWKCSNTYCHSNGGARDPDGTKESADYTLAVTPAWLAGDNTIIGNAERCNFCHGNSAETMVSAVGQKYNSQSHQKHLGTGTFLKTYSCKVCHTLTADSNIALASTGTNPRLVKDGGTHVNGVVNVSFNSTFSLGNGTLGTASYLGNAAGTCTVYCHSNGRAPYTAIITADWDNAASGACGACHSTAAAALSAPHSKHLAITDVVCADCHGTGAAAGTHTGHVDGTFTFSQTACDNCHGWLSGEKTPVWGESMTNDYCLTCHTGTTVGVVKTMTAPSKQHATDRGHNRTTNYTSGNLPGNKQCTSCHLTTITNHVNVTDGDATHLVAAATTCTATCHGPTGTASANTRGMVTHVDRVCTNCHDPHGDTTLATNIYMVRSVSTGTGNYSGSAVDFRVKSGSNSYDEVDAANADDLCATCHTYGIHPLSTHNTKTNQGIAHNEGTNCFTTCHKTHKEAGGAFIAGVGTACNQCHGNPPATGAHWNGILEAHSTTGSIYTDEPRDDCARCHTGADSYTYNVSADQTGGLNHSNKAGRRSILATKVGYQRDIGTNKWSCTTACHVSSKDDGFWYTWDGVTEDETTVPPSLRTPVGTSLACTACHYYDALAPSSANNSALDTPPYYRNLKGSHNAHFNKAKQCSACHDVPVVATTTHITTSGLTDVLKIEGRAQALQDEATTLPGVNLTGGNSCSGAGVALGCHNTKATPAWGAGSITCTNCHEVTGSATADPKTGLHNIGVTEAAAGVQKHDSTLPGGCTACHNSIKPATHGDGTFDNDTAVRTDRFLTVRVDMFVDNATANRGTCSGTGSLTGCHSDGGNWTRLWSTEANSTGTASGIARCNVCHGQFSTLSGSAGRGWNAGTSHYKTYGGATSTRGVSHKSQAGENNACEDCHSYTTLSGNHDTTATGGYKVTMNDDATTVKVTESVGRAWCAACHHTDMIPGDPLASGTYAFTQSVFPIQRVAGINDPKQECNNCHGDGTGRYWPMGIYGAGNAANDGGRHEIHMTRLTKSVYNQTVVELLADGDVKNKQIELCKYCHNATVPGTNPGHNDSALPAEVSATMYALWDTTKSTADAVTYTGTGANGTGTCANANCHNEKNTNSVALFTWHGTGTQNCLLCHNDITLTTAGTTGATHAAHTGSAATFGKDITCASCHGGSVTWSPYVVPTNDLHINGAFNVGTSGGGSVSFTYGGTYTNAATRTVGSCAINLCHNNGKNAVAPAYTWQTAIAGCAACHATSTTLGGSHNTHLIATFATTFGKTATCADCHDAVSAVSMAGKTAHMNGAVTLAAGLTYSGAPGTLDVTLATLGDCTGSCHTNGKSAAPVTAATWNSTYTNCNICHALPNTVGNDGARHLKHVGNTAKVPTSCGECHLTATTTTYNSVNHLNGTVQTGNKISDHTAGTETCTNSCHLVDSARGDWLDTAALACTDCHQVGSSYIGEAAKPLRAAPNGLHKALSAKAHNQTLAGGCNACHTTMTLDSPASHVNGVNTDANTTYGLFTPNYNTSTGTCYTTCHDDGGDWARKWIGVEDAKPQYADAATAAVCGNCHGSFAQGWRFVNEAGATTTDHTDPETVDNTGDQMNVAGHQVCSKCHGWGVAAYQTATKHQNSNLTMNSDLGYVDGTGGCTTNCHTPLTLTMQSNSGFLNDSGAYGALSCGSCHDDGVIPPNSGAHVAHGADADTDYSECIACHGDNGDSYTGMTLPHNNGTVNFAAGITYSDGGTIGTNAAALNDTCTTSQCHSAVGNPATWGTPASVGCNACHYYEVSPSGTNNAANANALTVTHNAHFNKGKICIDCHGTLPTNRTHIAAKAGTDGVALTLKANAAQNDADPVSRTTMAWDDDLNTCSGAGIGLGCHNTKTTPAWGTTGIACTNCHTAGGAAAADPNSGLHAITPTVSATKHDGTLASGNCINCHSATSPSSLHQNGSMQNSSAATFTFHSNVTGYSAAGCTATCHADAGDWARKWSTTAANTNGAECANCHGGIGVGYTVSTWNTGIIPDHTANWDGDVDGPEVMSKHSVCKSCHGFNGAADKDDNYLLTMHRNNSITMNGGTSYNETDFGCDNAGCHGTAAAAHALADSGWTVELGSFDAGGSCFGCHGNSVDQYWPDGSAYPDRAGAHIQHIPEIAAKMTGGNTLANRNATCIYCHPGGAHSGDQSASPADVCNTDTDNNGTADANTADKMIKLILNAGNPVPDSNGFWRSTPGTCSTVACHASAPFTPHWYADTVVPGAISNLASAASAIPGTVKLTWNATGDDGSLDGTAYVYDVRYRPSADGAISAGNWTDVNTKQAGNPPTVDRMSKAQSMIVDGLTANTSYTFAVKTADERYPDVAAWSAISNVVTASAQTDNVAPTFWGVDTAVSDCGGGVNLAWAAARDHTLPIGYRVYWSTSSLKEHLALGGTLPTTTTCYDAGSPPTENATCTAPDYTITTTTSTALKYRVTGLPPGVLYHFLVRAYDGAGTPNYDQNDDELMQMGQSTPSLPFTLGTYYANGTVTSSIVSMNNTGFTTTGTITLAATSGNVIFAAPAYTQKKNGVAISMDVYVKEDNKVIGQKLKYWFGYVTGTTFYYITPSGTPNIIDIGKSSARVRKLPLGGATGTIPSGSQAAVRLQNGTALGTLTVNWGSTVNSGLLLVNEQQFNNLPTAPVVNPNPPTVLGTPTPGVVNIVWNPSTDADSHAVHYDVFGSIDNGATFPFVIGRMLTGTSISWDTIGDGILANYTNTVRVKVIAGDTYLDGTLGSELHHSEAISNGFSLSNSIDGWPPAAVNNLTVETRPKQGAVALSWTAVGNDGYNHGSRAAVYDIRYSTSNITDDTTFNAASPALGEPVPTFSGEREGYELLGLTPDTTYYFAMKVSDEASNTSGISNVAVKVAGPKCGICHSTPPDESATAGNHIKHGYTMNDCANCHGSEAATFTTAHQDGQLKLGWKTATPYVGIQDGTRLYYTLNGLAGGTVIYDDNGLADGGASAGAGGFVNTGGDQIDNGRCFAFNAAGASGCHGPATPDWDVNETLACSACHGESGRSIDPYGRAYDDTSTDVSASPPVDNHGNSSGIYVGAHLKHLNFSFRLSKGDSCRLCHKDNLHADSNVDVTYDLAATGETALFTREADGVGTAASCGGTSVDTCHGTANIPRWDNTVEPVDCVGCHGFNGTTPNHVTDGSVRACTWCHPAGHPQGSGDTSTYEIPNNMAVGINYKSGGIHLLRTINGRGPYTTEAQICWGCHDANSVSEWGLDSSNANTVSAPGNGNAYNFGALFTAVGFTGPTSNWLGLGTGAYWQSGTTLFQTVKKGKIQSTHSTNPGGTSTVIYDSGNKRYNETLDAVADLRCSNCHDVHNMNKAKNDATSGAPYLRGTWKSTPYKEDGPPQAASDYSAHLNTAVAGNYGAVPRGGTAWTETGGYYIDQNSGSPTTGWTLDNSAGLCVLCHGSDVDNMDQTTGENLWMDLDTVTNGHSNSAIGGTFSKSVNIFDHGTSGYSGRPVAVVYAALDATAKTALVPDMQFQTQAGGYTGGAGYRGTASTGTYNGGYNPTLVGKGHQNDAFTWGVTIDAGTKDVMYHQFSCSKCHNPHASRLPKLLITNCLDVQHNTWDNSLATPNTQSIYTNAALTAVDRSRTAAYYASAANCHRYSDLQVKGGWNKVSPWTTANQ